MTDDSDESLLQVRPAEERKSALEAALLFTATTLVLLFVYFAWIA